MIASTARGARVCGNLLLALPGEPRQATLSLLFSVSSPLPSPTLGALTSKMLLQSPVLLWYPLVQTLVRSIAKLDCPRWAPILGKILSTYVFFFFSFLGPPLRHRSSWARSPIRAAAASLHCSHSNSRCKQLVATPDP